MITVAGLSPSLDLTYLVEHLAPGAIHTGPEVVRIAGGKSLNMARAATTLGADTTVVAILGGSTGSRLAAMLHAEGIAVEVVETPAETRTCVSVASADDGRLTEFYETAPAVPTEVWDAFADQLTRTAATRPGWLSISGRAPSGPPSVVGDLVRLGHAAGLQVAVDTHSGPLPGAVAAEPALVKINRYEAAGLLGCPDDTDLVVMARQIRERSHGIVVLTDGTAGAITYDGTTALHGRAPARTGRFPVGSGDSFLGGLLAVLDRGGDLEEALRSATGAGVANALVPGQGHFTAASAAEIAAETEIHRLT